MPFSRNIIAELVFILGRLSMCIIFVFFGSNAYSQDINKYKNSTPQELLEMSWKSFSFQEKKIIRHYLSKNYPEQAEGMFSTAFLASLDNREEDAKLSYKKCVEKFPNHLYSLANLSTLVEKDEALSLISVILSKDSLFSNYLALKLMYSNLYSDTEDTIKVYRYLKNLSIEMPNHYLPYFLWGRYEESMGRYEVAISKYEHSLKINSKDIDVLIRYVNLALNKITSSHTPTKERIKYIDTAIELFMKDELEIVTKAQVFHFFSEKLLDVFKDKWSAFKYYQFAFQLYPTAESVEGAYFAYRSNPTMNSFLSDAEKKLPNNPMIQNILGNWKITGEFDKKASKEHYLNSIAFSRTYKDSLENTIDMCLSYYQLGGLDYEESMKKIELLIENRHNLDNDLKFEIYQSLYYSSLQNLNFEKALTNFEKVARQGNLKESYYRAKQNELLSFIENEKSKDDFHKKNPFLKYWYDKFGENDYITFSYDKNDTIISTQHKSILSELVEIMSLPGAKDYTVRIEGHQSIFENENISQKRAHSIRKYLLANIEIDSFQIEILDYKAKYPIANEDSNSNQRIEISMLGSIDEPSIVATTVLKTHNTLAISPNNRFAALGNNPIQFWDIEREQKIRDLGLGGNEVAFSPNGRYLATISNNRQPGGWVSSVLFIYDIKTGIAIHQIPAPTFQKLSEFSWSPFSNQLVYSTNCGQLFLYDLTLRKRVAAGRMGPISISGVLLWHKSGRWIISGQAQDTSLIVHDASNLLKVRTLFNVDWPHALAQTYDGKYLICSDNTGYLSTWNIMDDWTLYDHVQIGQAAKVISEHPFEQIIILNSFSREKLKPLTTYHVEKKVIIDSITSTLERPKIQFSIDGKHIYRASTNGIDILSTKGLNLLRTISGVSGYAYSSKLDRENDYFLTVDEEGVKVWNILNGRKVYTWEKKPDQLHKVKGSSNLFIAILNNVELKVSTVYLYNTLSLTKKKLFELDFKVGGVTDADKLLVLYGPHFRDSTGNVKLGEILVIAKEDYSTLKRISNVNLVEDYLKFVGGEVPRAGFVAVDISNDKKEIIYATKWQDGFGHALSYATKCRRVKVSNGKLILKKTISTSWPIRNVSFEGDNDKLIKISGASMSKIYDRYNLSFFKYVSKGIGVISTTLLNGDTIQYNEENIIKISKGNKTIVRYPYSNLRDVEIFEDKNLLITLTSQNEIEFYDLRNLDKKLTIISKNNGEYISYTPEGQFVASENGANKIIWSLGDRYLEFNSLAEQYRKNTIIKSQLQAIFEKKEFNLPEGLKHTNLPPVISFIPANKKKTILSKEEDYIFEYDIIMSSSNQKTLEQIVVLNGDEVDPHLIGKTVTGDTINCKVKLKLYNEANTLYVFQMYNGHRLVQIEKKLYKNIKAIESDSRPRLWILGIGISDYSDTTKSLDFADKDIQDICALISKQKGITFKDVIIFSPLINEDVTYYKIKAALDSLNKAVEDNDVVLIYYSGHGIMYNEKLFIMPYDVDFDKPIKRYKVWNLIDFAFERDSDKARTILMLDMCSSGGIKNELLEATLSKYVRGNLSVIASCYSADDISSEDEKYGDGGNGAFTATLIEGIGGKADEMYVGNDNGEINLFELSIFLKLKVKALTKGKQVSPGVYNIGCGENFIIANIIK